MKIAALILITLSLWSFGSLTIITNPKQPSSRWLGIMALASGLGVLGVVLSLAVVPNLQGPTWTIFYNQLIKALYMIALYLTPYATLLFGITYSGLFNNQQHRLLGTVLTVPTIVMFFIYPINQDYRPSLQVIGYWAVPYIIAANFLVVYSYYQERNRRLKQQKLLTCLLFGPATILIEAVNFIFDIPNLDLWQYNAVMVPVTFCFFIILSIRYGVVGVRLKLEQDQLASTIKSVTSGTLILNHAIKNELTKIAICTDNIQNALANASILNPQINDNSQIIRESINYLTLMVKTIQNQVEEIVISKQELNLKAIVDKALKLLELYIKNKNINVQNNIVSDATIMADSFHLQEVLINIFKNAIDALDESGTIKIYAMKARKSVTITIEDNGKGIAPENLAHVFEPFFTTKSRNKNFGLGLTYCYNVLQKHGGSLEIASQENKGTTLFLTFPVS